jgi:NADH-quinone oxidoreductase subunit G|tara:strand:+ start:14155 stop:16920 length:2766 start_codon:yes stop_codon:yes gene_type:complete
MPKIIVDRISYEVDAGNNLLEALLSLKRDLPYFCWHPSMGSIGACRQCAVIQYRDEDDDTGRIVMACMTPVTEGAIFSTDTENAKQFRRDVIENMMINHPHDCPVCEEGGECHLQDMTVMTGHRSRKYSGRKNTFRNQYLGPFINHEMNRCITCYRCVRYYSDYAGGVDLAAFASRNNTYFGRHQDGVLESEFAGNLVEVCPTGVFTDRTLSEHYTRKWDLQSAPSICVGCGVGCNTFACERYGQLRRIHNRFNDQVNGYFLCDRGRFGGGFVNSEDRIPQAGIRDGEGKYDPVSREQAINHVADQFAGNSGKVVGIGSPRASLESNYLLKEIVGEANFYSGASCKEQELTDCIIDIMRDGTVKTASITEAEEADAVLVLGEDLTNRAPRLALAVRQSVRSRSKELALQASIPLWQDHAVRELAQNELSPLVLLTSSADRLEDVASVSHQSSAAEIARMGFAVANGLNDRFAAVDDLGAELQQTVDQVVEILKSAKRPLIVSGSGSQSRPVVEAAANVAWALHAANIDASIVLCVPECNSLGVGLLDRENGNTLSDLMQSSDDIATAIVLENDLYRRASTEDVSAFLAKVGRLVSIDSLDNATVSSSDVVLPAATFAETGGTLINYEGRAQRSFAVYEGKGDIQGSWQWLLSLGRALKSNRFASMQVIDDVTADCAGRNQLLAGIANAAPSADYRANGMKIARMTHRASGRTAMRANIDVHEPKQPVDQESALAYTMEGLSGPQAPLSAYVWSPGWTSNQSVHKFQTETGGPLTQVDPGVRLLEPAAGDSLAESYREIPAQTASQGGPLALIPRYHIFGSDELSARSKAIAELAPTSYLAINQQTAERLSVASKDGVEFTIGDQTAQLEVVVDSSVNDGYALFPAGLADTLDLMHQTEVSLKKAANWIPRKTPADRLIAKE